MLYYILKYISKLMMRGYFGRVYITGLEKVPRDKPLILAANHQSAFLEPVLLGGIMPFPVHFITRGDIFVKRWMWFFNAVNMIPIFRFHDGFSQMKRNMDSFQHVYNALDKNARIIIFCEGRMKWEKKLHPLQLGAARMAVGGYEHNNDLDIYVVPIGINYEDHLTFRRYVKISFGEPVRVNEHTQNLEDGNRQALKSVTETLAKNLRPEVIHIESENHYDLGNKVLSMFDNERQRKFFPFFLSNEQIIRESIEAAGKTDKLDKDEELLNLVKEYTEKLNGQFTYRDYVLRHKGDFGLFRSILFYLIVLPLGVCGVILNGLPAVLGDKITHSNTTVPEFIGSLRSNVGTVLLLLYYLTIFIVLLFFSWKIALTTIAIMFLSGIFALYFSDRKSYWAASRYWSSIPAEKRQEIKSLRDSIINAFQS